MRAERCDGKARHFEGERQAPGYEKRKFVGNVCGYGGPMARCVLRARGRPRYATFADDPWVFRTSGLRVVVGIDIGTRMGRERSTADEKLGKTLKPLFDAALKARAHAYAPYSRFPVGAALRSLEGGVFAGCNVENASYPIVTCAEAGAIAAMIAAGHREIAEFLVVGGAEKVVTPCGACRQRLREFARPDVQVHCMTPGGERTTYSVGALLPSAFGPEHLTDEL